MHGACVLLSEVIKITADYIDEKSLDNVLSALMPQNRLIIEICIATGLRIGDVLRMPAGIKQRGTIREEKTGKSRSYYIPKDLFERVNAQKGLYFLFPGARDEKKHKTRQAVWYDIKRAQKLFRMPENIGTHTARKIYAVAEYNKHGDIQRVKEKLNHESESVTLIYIMADLLTQKKIAHRKGGRKK